MNGTSETAVRANRPSESPFYPNRSSHENFRSFRGFSFKGRGDRSRFFSLNNRPTTNRSDASRADRQYSSTRRFRPETKNIRRPTVIAGGRTDGWPSVTADADSEYVTRKRVRRARHLIRVTYNGFTRHIVRNALRLSDRIPFSFYDSPCIYLYTRVYTRRYSFGKKKKNVP